MVELRIIEKKDLFNALIQHKKGFLPTFIKYKDKINPVFRNYFDFKKYYNSAYLTMFWIIYNNQRVGQIWIKTKDSTASLARIFILKKWQNKGIAQNAIIQAEKLFDSYKLWMLDTIEQEKNNCHLYEKMGYKRTGGQEIINKRMTIIYYEKRFE